MKDNTKSWLYGPYWQGIKCEARTRRGTLCQRPGNKINGRCKLHGGRSSGPKTEAGLARLTGSKITHGRYIKAEREKAVCRAEVGRIVMREVKAIEQWAVDHGHLSKDWRDQFK